jgi:O-antigen ligase
VTGYALRLHQLPFYFLLAAVVLAPLPFGSVQIGAWSLLAFVAGLATACWAMMAALGVGPDVRAGRLKWPLAAFLLVVGWIVIQLGTLTPVAWHHPIWTIASDALGESLAGRVAIDPQAGWFALIRLLGYAAIFWLAFQYGGDAKLAARALRVFTVAGAAAAGLGLVIWSAGLTRLLWFDDGFVLAQMRYGSRLAIPFVNPNHLASFAAIGLITSIGLIAAEVRGLWRPETAAREKLRRFIDTVVGRHWLLLVSCMIYVTALVLSQSRGGIAAALVGLLVLWAALLRRTRPSISRMVPAAVVGLVVAATVFAPTIGRFADRIGKVEAEAVQRMEIYRNAINAIEASPVLGYGYGGFPALYRMYDQNDVGGVVDYAHSTVLEIVVELGIPAAAVLFAALLWPIVACWRGARLRQRDQHIPALATAAAAVAAIHSMVDFPLQIPAIAAAFALILGLGFAQSVSSKTS